MKLWLDDERTAPEGWARVMTAKDAICVLTNYLVTDLSLDHDLGPPEAGTGYDVLVWLEMHVFAEPAFHVPTLAVHSMNPVGRAKMLQAIAAIGSRRE